MDSGDVSDRLKYSYQPPDSYIDFKVGFPDPAHLPIRDVQHAFQEMFCQMQERPDFFQYCFPYNSYVSVRKELGKFLARLYALEKPIREEHLVISAGVSGGLDLILTSTGVDRTRIVYCEELSYFAAHEMFKERGCELRSIPFKKDGQLDLDYFKQKLESNPEDAQRTALVYIIPTFHNPTGVTMNELSRRQIIELAHEFDFYIASDEVYNTLCFSETKEQMPTSLALLDDEETGRVFSLGSFSKVVFPALRFGWIHASTSLFKKLDSAGLHVSGSCPTHLSAGAVEILMQSRKIDEIIDSASRLLQLKAFVLFESLQKHLPEDCFVGAFKELPANCPLGGYFLVVTLPEGISAIKLATKANDEFGLDFLPTKICGDSLDNKIRLCFAYHSAEKIREGAEKLCRCIESAVNRK